MAPSKKGGEKKDHSAINKEVNREYAINIHKLIHGVGFKKCALRHLKEIQNFTMKGIGTPDMHITPDSTRRCGLKG